MFHFFINSEINSMKYQKLKTIMISTDNSLLCGNGSAASGGIAGAVSCIIGTSGVWDADDPNCFHGSGDSNPYYPDCLAGGNVGNPAPGPEGPSCYSGIGAA